MGNVRIRGKIRREEWTRIAERFRKGETLAEIARSYDCTAPAIRYIVRRTNQGEVKHDKPESAAAPVRVERELASAEVVSVGARTLGARGDRHSPGEVWDRISSDIASFLAGMDALSENGSDENYEALLLATDRLLRASARTRLELERVLDSRKMDSRKVGNRRRVP